MREGARAHLRGWLRGATHREWAWLGASLLVALTTVATLVTFGSYGDGHTTAAANAVAAELAASQINAIEWQSIAEGRLLPGTGARAGRLLGAVVHHLEDSQRSVPARQVLGAYASAVQAEFGLLAAGRVGEARRVDKERVDPAFRAVSSILQRLAVQNAQAAGRARSLETAADITTTGLGFAVVVVLLLRFGAARRGLAAAAVEERMLRTVDQAKNDLISVVSHDLRTPLTSIIGYLELLLDSEAGPLKPEQRRLLDVVTRNADRLLVIANDLLFVSRAEAGRIELTLRELSLERAAANAVEAQQPAAREQGLHLRCSTVPSAPIMADRHRIDVLIENLVSNAMKFTPSGGSVEVAVRPVDHRVRLEVSDTGVGISPVDQEHLFEKFFRSRERTDTPGSRPGPGHREGDHRCTSCDCQCAQHPRAGDDVLRRVPALGQAGGR
jgi:signal transduction histidine kinase